MKFIRAIKDSTVGDNKRSAGYCIRLKDLKPTNPALQPTQKMVFEGLKPTPLNIKDILRRLCAKDGGSLTIQAHSVGIPYETVDVRCKNTLLDMDTIKKKEVEQLMRMPSAAVIARFDRNV